MKEIRSINLGWRQARSNLIESVWIKPLIKGMICILFIFSYPWFTLIFLAQKWSFSWIFHKIHFFGGSQIPMFGHPKSLGQGDLLGLLYLKSCLQLQEMLAAGQDFSPLAHLGPVGPGSNTLALWAGSPFSKDFPLDPLWEKPLKNCSKMGQLAIPDLDPRSNVRSLKINSDNMSGGIRAPKHQLCIFRTEHGFSGISPGWPWALNCRLVFFPHFFLLSRPWKRLFFHAFFRHFLRKKCQKRGHFWRPNEKTVFFFFWE